MSTKSGHHTNGVHNCLHQKHTKMQAYATLTDQGVTSKIRDLRSPASDRRCAGPFRLRFITMVVRDSCRSGRWRGCGWCVHTYCVHVCVHV